MVIELLERHKRRFLIAGIGICLLSIVLTINPGAGSNIFSSGLSYIVTPMQRGFNAVIAWVQGNYASFTNSQGLIAENLELR